MRRVMCWQCGRRAPMEEALARVRAGEDDPHCLVCGGILKSDTISFGQSLVPEVIDRALTRRRPRPTCCSRSARRCRCSRSRAWCRSRRAPAPQVVIVNDQETAMDELADVVVRAPIGAVLTAICGDRGH